VATIHLNSTEAVTGSFGGGPTSWDWLSLLFGSYVGTEHRPGFWWINPFNSKRKISRRLEALESGPLKVNDAVGNPIDIGAVIVWRVEDAAKALLEVGSYANYVKAQSETALLAAGKRAPLRSSGLTQS
jgi:regulator of protease activity HflC (stomatin/prohibitin superfamily)